ncbi:glycosyltransferase family 4 protein [Natrinema sp. 74]|uniref:glycosyltransferase family 4 protein n=1 Tax=Natrinema sp. 74 TaxID=3384159 RepID=UPI0038D3CD9D
MRVLLAAHALPPDTYGGTELYTVRLAEAIADRGHSVTVAAPRGADATVDGATVVRLPDPAPTPRPDDGIDPAGAEGVVRPAIDAAVADLLEARDPDLVHLQHLKGLSAGIPTVCADAGVPCIATLHDFWTLCHREQLRRPDGARCSGPDSLAKCVGCYADAVGRHVAPAADDPGMKTRDRWDQREHERDGESGPRNRLGLESVVADPVARRTDRLRRALTECDRLVSPSRFLRDVFVEYGTDPNLLVHRRNGIRTGRFGESTFDPDDPLHVGYAGRIAESKGVHLLLAALEWLPDADLAVHVHGRFEPDAEPYHARLRKRAAGEPRVRFHGRYGDAADVFPTFDVFVLPSVWLENSPLVIQEAFAAGVPVVTGDRGGMAELVDDGVDGLTVPVGDAAALAATLRRLAADPDLVRRLRAGVAEPTTLGDHADDLLALYREHGPADASEQGGDETSERGRSVGDA